MRILLANDSFGHAGGVQTYLDAVIAGLRRRGHHIAIAYPETNGSTSAINGNGNVEEIPLPSAARDLAISALRRWCPDVVFSHNMAPLDVERQLLDVAPVVKFMHGYFGTCMSGEKRFALPLVRACDRRFGRACLALYGPRRCGELDAATFLAKYRWTQEQNGLFGRYRGIVVASEHMRREYIANGADPKRVHTNPLFATHDETMQLDHSAEPSVVFFGRMTHLKGGDLLIDAVARASRELGRDIRLTMVGEGPQRAAWERLTARLNVRASFVGWQTGDDRWKWLQGATLLAVPSTWPEPFGLVGLEAAALGVPAIAFDVGGVREWLTSGVNGYLVPADPPRASAFATALVRALRDRDKLSAMRTAARKIAREMSLARHLDRLEPILMETTEPRAHSAGR